MFKVGDKVRTNPKTYADTGWDNLIIKKINLKSPWPIACDIGSGDEGLFSEDELELIPDTISALVVKTVLPTEATERKKYPIGTGLIDYFPAALAEVSKVSYQGNLQHNPGQPLHWSRGKSKDHSDTLIRHFLERGTLDTDGMRHSAKMVWRALAILQLELEEEGSPIARGAK